MSKQTGCVPGTDRRIARLLCVAGLAAWLLPALRVERGLAADWSMRMQFLMLLAIVPTLLGDLLNALLSLIGAFTGGTGA